MASSSFQPPSFDASDFLSIGDRLGGKRIDNAIERTRVSSIPIQGAQSGGYAPAFAHLSHIPLFPLYHEKQNIALEKQEYRKQQQLQYVKPPMQQSAGTKLLFSVMSLLGGGGNPMSVAKWENRLKGVGAVQMQKSMEQSHSLVFTRWSLPPSNGQDVVFVDVLEWRANHGAAVYIKVSRQLTFRTVGKEKELKVGKTWSKRFLSGEKGRCDAVSLLEGVEERELVVVARIERPCAGLEARESLKVFEKEWVVPVVVLG
ncbi:uncharacterized protein PAC_03521 [Phialocephala subalpina]|uniref:Uncharacterized protein n=1 Tax=Phialocephala subalpina TaxID=576137 RepID=A0A1L7WLJ2_9HELO|nr:uncharacterized protein PAC_03521 [Phialocephala subalpina]